jgi:hypothetical protein
MGQEITVTARAGASPTVRIFDCNRSITGMAIESYPSLEDTAGGVTVEAPEDRWPTLEGQVEETIQHLFGYYGDDAGWSPDSLRAIGVEPIFPPEPAGD